MKSYLVNFYKHLAIFTGHTALDADQYEPNCCVKQVSWILMMGSMCYTNFRVPWLCYAEMRHSDWMLQVA